MSSYLLAIIGGTILVAVLTLLAPNSAFAGRIRLISSFFLICVLLSPTRDLLARLGEWSGGTAELPWEERTDDAAREELLQTTLDEASKHYVQQILTERLEEEFSVPTGDVRCEILWSEDSNGTSVRQVTVFLSGRGIWKDTAAIERYICTLLDCTCTTVLE